MATNQPPNRIDQKFLDSEKLFRRVLRKNMKHDGKATFLAFELPDMSVNRERHSTAEDARKQVNPENFGVVSFLASEMPAREALPHESHSYHFRARHVPEVGNFAHSEVRVWREDAGTRVLITVRTSANFEAEDPDRDEPRVGTSALDPDFHMRWRKRIEWCCQPELPPVDEAA